MNIGTGLNRLAIFVIGCYSLIAFSVSAVCDCNRYQRDSLRLDSIKYTFVPEEGVSKKGWSFAKFKYEEAINAGYSDKELVEYLSGEYSDFDLKVFQYEAKLIKRENLCKTLCKSAFYSILISVCLYLSCLVFYLVILWVYRGFKKKDKAVLS